MLDYVKDQDNKTFNFQLKFSSSLPTALQVIELSGLGA